MKTSYLTVAGRYEIKELVATGAFCRVHRGLDLVSSAPVAIKIVIQPTGHPCLLQEFTLSQSLQSSHRKCYSDFPKVYWHGEHQSLETSVSELVGPTLLDLHEKCANSFSLKTAEMIGNQLLTGLEELHSIGFLHGDLKPDNVAIGLPPLLTTLYLLDFTLSSQFLDHGKHVELSLDSFFQGNPYWASLNVLRGLSPSRRDDLESLGYMIVFLIKGKLPWHGSKKKSASASKTKIRMMKEAASMEELCEGLPQQFEDYFLYVKRLKYDEKPDYDYLRTIFTDGETQCDWTTNPAAQSFIDSRTYLNKKEESGLEQGCDAQDSSDDESEDDDQVEFMRPSSKKASERRQTISTLPDLTHLQPGGKRRKSVLQQVAQLQDQGKAPGRLFEVTHVNVTARRHSCVSSFSNTIKEAKSALLPVIDFDPSPSPEDIPQTRTQDCFLPTLESEDFNESDHEEKHLPVMSQALRLKLKKSLL